jgi:HEAT repeat protein
MDGRPLQILLWALLVGGPLLGCASDARPRAIDPDRDLFDPDPGRRLAAVAVVANEADESRLGALVELLEDRDPSVRMAANRALEDMTGRVTGYRAYDPPGERRPFVEEWRAYVEHGASGFPRVEPAGEGS